MTVSDSLAMERSADARSRRRWILPAVGLAVVAGVIALWFGIDGESKAAGAGRGRWGAPGGPGDAQPTAVRAEKAVREDLTLRAHYTGELDADATEVAARTAGLLLDVGVRIGDEVKEGQLLARVDAAEARRQLAEAEAQARVAEANRRRAKAQLQAAEAELSRTEPLVADQLVSPQDADSLRARVESLRADEASAAAQIDESAARAALLEKQVRDARLVAPFRGRVAERHLDPGTTVQPGTPVVRVVAKGALRVQFRVPEHDAGRIQRDMVIEVRTQAVPEQVFHGKVERVSAEVSRTDRTLAVEGLLEDEDPVLLPGMYAEVRILLGTLEGATTVASAAVLERLSQKGAVEPGVFVAKDGKAAWTPVAVLARAEGRIAVDGSINPGDQVLTLGHESLDDGAPVHIVKPGDKGSAKVPGKRGGKGRRGRPHTGH